MGFNVLGVVSATVDRMTDIRRDQPEVWRSHRSRFRTVLPEVKVARFVQTENTLDVLVSVEPADSISFARTGG